MLWSLLERESFARRDFLDGFERSCHCLVSITAPLRENTSRSEEHTSELQSHSDLHSFPTRRSSDLVFFARAKAGNNIAAKIAMIAMTTNNSISVNALVFA